MICMSIIMSEYNTPPIYLRQAIESILEQSFTDFELIIVNDCSKDNTVQLVQTFAAEHNF